MDILTIASLRWLWETLGSGIHDQGRAAICLLCVPDGAETGSPSLPREIRLGQANRKGSGGGAIRASRAT
jgi:hypothetical protein